MFEAPDAVDHPQHREPAGPRPSPPDPGRPGPRRRDRHDEATACTALAVTSTTFNSNLGGPPPSRTAQQSDRSQPTDTITLRRAYHDFLAVADTAGFAAPPTGEWTARQLLAHIVAADTGITAIALGVASGQRPTYDNRYSLDGWNLDRLVDQTPELPGLINLVRQRGELLCDVAEQLSPTELEVPVHCLILSGFKVMADAAQPLGRLIKGVAAVHLPRHANQLAALHATST